MATQLEDRPATPAEPVMVGVGWVARALGCSPRHVHRMRDAGLMPRPVKLGALVRWSRKAIEQWIAAGCPAERKG
jgi:predicted DNA-binding transcriptional regulator AlpA